MLPLRGNKYYLVGLFLYFVLFFFVFKLCAAGVASRVFSSKFNPKVAFQKSESALFVDADA